MKIQFRTTFNSQTEKKNGFQQPEVEPSASVTFKCLTRGKRNILLYDYLIILNLSKTGLSFTSLE